MRFWSNGLGSTLGDPLILQAAQMWVSSTVYWVDGNDSAASDSNPGTERRAPLATLEHAIGIATAYSIIVLADGHEETLTSSLLVQKDGIVIVGEGKSSGIPTVKLKFDHTSVGIALNNEFCEVRNVRFPERVQASTEPKVEANNGTTVVGCYFEADENSDGAEEIETSGAVRIKDCTFLSTATDPSEAPGPAVAQNGSFLAVEGCVFDGGTTGWHKGYALEVTASDAGLFAENISLLRGADVKVLISTTGWVHVGTSTGAARIDIDSGGGPS